MGLLSKIFGTKEIIEGGFDLIDKMHTSDEEEIKARVQGKIDLLNSYSAFKVAQRVLAFLFTGNFIVSFWVVVYLWATKGDMEGFLEIMEIFNMGWIMLTIVTFYFGGGFLEGTFNAAKKKKE